MSDEQKRRGRPPKVRETAPDELEARNNRAEQGNAADAPDVVPAVAPELTTEPAGDMLGWIDSIERDAPPMLVAVTHPKAADGIHPGKFSGIRMSHGPMAAYWSDGSKT